MDDLTRKIRDDSILEVARRLRAAINEKLNNEHTAIEDDGAWVREPIAPADAKAGLRALSFIGLHDLTPEEMKHLVALTGKLDALSTVGGVGVSAFLRDVEEACKRHNISIGHEDGHGRFLILDYDDPRGSFGGGSFYDKRKKVR